MCVNPLDVMQIFHSAYTNHMMRLQIPPTKRWFNRTALPIEMETGKVFSFIGLCEHLLYK